MQKLHQAKRKLVLQSTDNFWFLFYHSENNFSLPVDNAKKFSWTFLAIRIIEVLAGNSSEIFFNDFF